MTISPEILALSLPLIQTSVDTWVKPVLEKISESKKFDENFNKMVEENFVEYLNRAYHTQIIMDTIVFKNMQKKIDDLYIPMEIESCDTDPVISLINKYPQEIVNKYGKILVVDNAGMGKSTLMKWMFISVIRENKGIPIFINLRRLNSSTTILDFIIEELNGIKDSIDKEYILFLLSRGDFIFFFDGFDEIASGERASVLHDLQRFISKCGSNVFFLSSREESSLTSFGDFYRFSIVALNEENAFNLLRKYDGNGVLSKELIEKLNADDNLLLLKEFLENPLMTSLLYKAYEYKKILPYKKHIFYRQVYNALFDEHDLSKGDDFEHNKQSCLDVDDFHKVLRGFAFISMARGKNSYEKEELISILERVKSLNSDIEFDINLLIKDCIQAVPLLIQEGLEYKWVHKSFLEYFTALYLRYDSYEKLPKLLSNIMSFNKISRYLNVLDFYYDLDQKSFKLNIMLPVSEEYVRYYDIEFERIKLDYVDESQKKIRIATHYTKNAFVFKEIPFKYDENITGDYFNKSIKFLEKNKEFKKEWLNSGSMVKGEYSECYIVQRSILISFVDLLERKQDNNILSEIPKSYIRGASIDNYRSGMEYDYYHLDGYSDNVFNDEKNYDMTTSYILFMHRGFERSSYFDIDKCRRFIIEQREVDSNDIFELEMI